jgi:ABC-type dipeptide/oligopeptide/nickel transport system permease subunit
MKSRGAPTLLRAVVRSKSGLLGLILILIPVVMALFPQYIAPYDPYKRVAKPFLPPSSSHLLGTNDVGQDIFSELVYGARISLFVGIAAALSTVVLGTLVGMVSGYAGGLIDEVLMSVTDTMLLIPVLPLMILLSAFMGRGYMNIVMVITIFAWPSVARYVRAQVVSLKAQPFIEAAKAAGASTSRILFKHVAPQVVPTLIALVMLRVGASMIAEAALSFLGFGDPTQKSWGTMIYWARRSGALTAGAWWWVTMPGLMITVTVLGFTQLGYVLEEYYNPRLRRI